VGVGDWLKYADIQKVESDEDFALHVLVMGKGNTDKFNKLLDRKYGRSVQQVRMANPEGQTFKVEHDVTSAREKLFAKLMG
jgi:hypothetical protein